MKQQPTSNYKMTKTVFTSGMVGTLIGLSLYLSGCNKPEEATSTDKIETTQQEHPATHNETQVAENIPESATKEKQVTTVVPENDVTNATDTSIVETDTKSQAELDAEAEALAAADEVVE